MSVIDLIRDSLCNRSFFFFFKYNELLAFMLLGRWCVARIHLEAAFRDMAEYAMLCYANATRTTEEQRQKKDKGKNIDCI